VYVCCYRQIYRALAARVGRYGPTRRYRWLVPLDDGMGHVLAAAPQHRAMATCTPALDHTPIDYTTKETTDKRGSIIDWMVVTSTAIRDGIEPCSWLRRFGCREEIDDHWVWQEHRRGLRVSGFIDVKWCADSPATLITREDYKTHSDPLHPAWKDKPNGIAGNGVRRWPLPSRDIDRHIWMEAINTASHTALLPPLYAIVFDYFDC
jgi:hypothetical protein